MSVFQYCTEKSMICKMVEMIVLFIVCILNTVLATTDQNDASALGNMFTSLNSPSQLANWKQSGGDPCGQSWEGITCSGTRVTEIKLSGLGLSGSMGYQLSSLTALINLDMSNNNLRGNMPYQLPPNLTRLDLSNNQFNGDVQYSISQLTSLNYLNLSHNQLQNQLNLVFGNQSSLSTMDISFNALTGKLPESFGSLSNLNTLYLQNNQFTGTIDVLTYLPIKNLNVANNHFNGWIPKSFTGINMQTDGNNWNSGSAPPPPPGTPHIYKSRTYSPGNDISSTSETSNGKKKSGIGSGGIAAIVISVCFLVFIFAFFVARKRSRSPFVGSDRAGATFNNLSSNDVWQDNDKQSTPSYASGVKDIDTPSSKSLILPKEQLSSQDDKHIAAKPVVTKASTADIDLPSYSVADLQVATGSFSMEYLLGEGSLGHVYKAHFGNGKALAVKKIDPAILGKDASVVFLELVSRLSFLHHPNVLELNGYCSEYSQHLLIYEFVKNGSLYDSLHPHDGPQNPLIWNSRVKIALGTARALEYLHEVCLPSIIHKNIKSTNILLDDEFNSRLSNCGLSFFTPNADQVLKENTGSGYCAPEVIVSGEHTLKSDVYSFGVVMLELLTGRKPFDSTRSRLEQSLVRWATPKLHDIDALSKMVDPALEGLYPVKSLSRFADVIALCIQPEPEFRPPMSEVVQALVLLVQRTDMSRRTIGSDHGALRRGDFAS